MGKRFERGLEADKIEAAKNLGIADLLLRINGLRPDLDDPLHAFDIHLRERSEIMVYHGGTRLLIINLRNLAKGEEVSFQTGKSYQLKCAESFGKIPKPCKGPISESIADSVCEFLCALARDPARNNMSVNEKFVVGKKWFRNGKEGYWSNVLSIDYGRDWVPSDDWLIIDREAVIGFDGDKGKKGSDEKDAFYKEKKSKAKSISDALMSEFKENNKYGTGIKSFGDEVDFLAIDKDKHLVCIELKHSSFTSGIYWGPLQAAVYRDAYQDAINDISEGIKRLVQSKVELGLLPSEALDRLPKGSFPGVVGVLAVTAANEKLRSSCWSKAVEVNGKLPQGVDMLRTTECCKPYKWVGPEEW